MLSSEHERVKSCFRHTAPVFTTNVNEHGSGASSFLIIFVIIPVSLSVSSVILEVEMVNLVLKSRFYEVVYIDDR